MQPAGQNRNLRFATLDEALKELERLQRSRVATLGIWSFYQILRHLADHIEYSFTGYPTHHSTPQRVARLLFLQMKRKGYMPAGIRSIRGEEERIEGDEGYEMERLRQKIKELKTRTEFSAHPLFGTLSPEEWHTVHAFHIANHLSFLIPVSDLKRTRKKSGGSAKKGRKAPARKKAAKKKGKKTSKKNAKRAR